MNVIDLDLIALEINRRLGSEFRVHINGNPHIDRTGLGVEAILSAQRTPFSIKDVESETMNLDLEIWANCESSEKRVKIMRDLGKLLGHSTGVLDGAQQGETFDYALFLELQRPVSPPEADMGVFRQLLLVTGNMLVSGREKGAVMSNNIYTYLISGETDGNGQPYRGYLPTLSFTGSGEYSAENFRRLNRPVSDPEQVAEVWAADVTALLLNRSFDSYLSKRLQLVKQFTDDTEHSRLNQMNELFTLERIMPDYTYSKRVKLLGGNIIEQAGAFAQIRLSVQEVEDG